MKKLIYKSNEKIHSLQLVLSSTISKLWAQKPVFTTAKVKSCHRVFQWRRALSQTSKCKPYQKEPAKS
jgi:hypothetical protein